MFTRGLKVRIVLLLVVCAFRLAPSTAQQPSSVSQVRAQQSSSAAAATAGVGSIRGRIMRGDNSRPLAKARVHVLGRGGLRETMTDVNGQYEISALSPGDYSLQVSRAGFETAVFGARGAGRSVPVRAGRVTDAADISMLPASAVIAGQVVDEHGSPLAGARVQAIPRSTVEGTEARDVTITGATDVADDLGRFRLFGLARGDYYVTASVSNLTLRAYRGSPALSAGTFYPGIRREDATFVHVENASLAWVAMTTPTRPVVLSGRVVNADETQTSVSVAASYGVGASSGRAVGVSDEGTFRLDNVFPGEYTITAKAADRIGLVTVGIVNADVDVAVVLRSPGQIRGQLSFDSASARSTLRPASVNVRANVRQGGALTTAGGTVNNSWAFTISNLMGPATLDVRLPQGWMVSRITRGGEDITDTAVDFSSGVAVVDVHVTRQVTTLNGTVTDQRGRAVADALVVIFAEDSARWTPPTRFVRTVRPDRSGRFSVEGLPPARYLALALPSSGMGDETHPDRLEQLRPLGTRVTVEQGAPRTVSLRTLVSP
jgi:protocatechuate 3,4-dioxygenase beta subunit